MEVVYKTNGAGPLLRPQINLAQLYGYVSIFHGPQLDLKLASLADWELHNIQVPTGR